MTIPGFTAESSLGKVREDYVFRPGAPAASGGVVPQGLSVDRGGNIWYCDPIVGCTIVGHIIRPVLF
jgi:hypothetical protein